MIDLHMHTNCSDGKDSVIEILENCEKAKLSYISITDHDNCRAYDELDKINIKDYYTGTIIKGIEFKCNFNGRRIEVLGYNIDINTINKFLADFYKDKTFSIMQTKYFNKLYSVCKDKGLKIDKIEDIIWDSNKDWASLTIYRELKKYKENEELLPEDLWNSHTVFTRKYTSNKQYDFYISKTDDNPDVSDVIDAIKLARGVSILAHPYIYSLEDTDKFLNEIISNTNINGIECYHSSFSNEQIKHLKEFCTKNKLCISGGSDYHGRDNYIINLGVGKGNLNIPDDIAENILKYKV